MLSETAVATEYMAVFVLIHVALGQVLKLLVSVSF